MVPPKLQFAFQGGGAKFISMLPVAAAIKDLAAEEKISIATLAGTSAGAICAGLVAGLFSSLIFEGGPGIPPGANV